MRAGFATGETPNSGAEPLVQGLALLSAKEKSVIGQCELNDS